MRLFPLNKIVDGSAQYVDLPKSFKENLCKINPRLSKVYEKKNKELNLQLSNKKKVVKKLN